MIQTIRLNGANTALEDEAVQGLAATRWPGRMEVL